MGNFVPQWKKKWRTLTYVDKRQESIFVYKNDVILNSCSFKKLTIVPKLQTSITLLKSLSTMNIKLPALHIGIIDNRETYENVHCNKIREHLP